MSARTALHERIRSALRELGAAENLVEERKLPAHADAQRLTPVGLGTDGRDRLLTPVAAKAWLAMRDAAAREGVELLLVSAFRSFDFQLALIRGKLAKGRSIAEIFTVNAPPGCSEHHTGRAVDIGSSGTPPLEEDFENTAAFQWLTRHASRFGFSMSYPRNNPHGYLYEPWHWCHHGRSK
jgi:D-alanyl-D-alanine carboxypeptidase